VDREAAVAGKLTATEVRSKVAKGKQARHADGGNLYLFVTGRGAAKWTLRYVYAGKSREMGLGNVRDVALAEAREAATAARKLLRNDVDPIAHRAAQRAAEAGAAHTFDDVAALYIAAHRASWRNDKHAAQWEATLKTHASPKLGKLPVARVDTGAVMSVLEPLWRRVPETATRLRGRIEAVLDYAKSRGWRDGENPARWRGHLANLLPARAKVARVQHHPALPWREVGGFMADLRTRDGVAACALEFAILTAARSGEVRGMRWGEVDWQTRTWTVPAERMKAGREHRVPLSDSALDVLGAVRLGEPAADAFVFPSPIRTRPTPLSDMTLTAVLRRMNRDDLTVHGFRSTFRDWAAESTGYPREVAEAALAHTLSDKVEAAYRRGDLIEKRARLMADWACFCAAAYCQPTGNVVALQVA